MQIQGVTDIGRSPFFFPASLSRYHFATTCSQNRIFQPAGALLMGSNAPGDLPG